LQNYAFEIPVIFMKFGTLRFHFTDIFFEVILNCVVVEGLGFEISSYW